MQFLPLLLASASVVFAAAAAPPPPATSSPSSVVPGHKGLPNWCDGGVISDGSCEKKGLNTYCVRQKNYIVAFFGVPLSFFRAADFAPCTTCMYADTDFFFPKVLLGQERRLQHMERCFDNARRPRSLQRFWPYLLRLVRTSEIWNQLDGLGEEAVHSRRAKLPQLLPPVGTAPRI